MEKAERFWMVFSPQGNSPRVRHRTKERAKTEARRLSANNPGSQFFVLRAIKGFCADQPNVERIKLVAPPPDLDDPF